MSQALRAHYVVFLLLPLLAVAQQPLSRVTLGILTSMAVVDPLQHSSMQQPPGPTPAQSRPKGVCRIPQAAGGGILGTAPEVASTC